MADEKLALLRKIPLFERLNGHDLQRVGKLADEIDVPEGRVLMREGERGSEMFVVASGSVKVERAGKVIDTSTIGSWFGEMAILSEGTRNATITTTEPSRLFVIAHREFHALMDEMPSVRSSVLECVADRLRKLEPGAAH